MCNFSVGVVVPIPTLPLFKTTKLDPVVPPIMRVDVAMIAPCVDVPEMRELPWTLNVCMGVVVPMPRNEFTVSVVRKFAESIVLPAL